MFCGNRIAKIPPCVNYQRICNDIARPKHSGFGFDFFDLGEELLDGALHPAVQGIGGKRATQAGTTQAHFEHFAVEGDELN